MLGAYLSITLTIADSAISFSRSRSAFRSRSCSAPPSSGCSSAISITRDHLQQVLLTFGLILIFNEAAAHASGARGRTACRSRSYLAGSIKLSDVLSYPVYRIAVAAICVALALAMMFVIQRTRVGRMIRAGESNREMVEVLGIDTRLLFRFVFAAGVSLAAAAGIIAAPIESVYPGHRRARAHHLASSSSSSAASAASAARSSARC